MERDNVKKEQEWHYIYSKIRVLILIIDTANPFMSLCIQNEDEVIASRIIKEEYQHARQITREINFCLQESGLKKQEIEAVAINQGPGSFTGLRVGVSVAKGICYALKIPMIAVDGPESYGLYYDNAYQEFSDIWVLIDARRQNYFFAQVRKGEVIIPTRFGGIEEIKLKVEQCKRPLVILNSDRTGQYGIEAQYLAEAVWGKYKNRQFVQLAEFEPNYYVNNYLRG